MTDRQTNRERKTDTNLRTEYSQTDIMKSQHTKKNKDSTRTNRLEKGIERARWLLWETGREVINGMDELICQYQTDKEKRDGAMTYNIFHLYWP